MGKRKLTNDEIDSIINSFQPKIKLCVPKQSILDINLQKLKNQLETVEIYPQMLSTFVEKIKKQFYTTKISPGENVGILVAQSIGEKQTQMSIGYNEYVYIKKNGLVQNVEIGKFIDQYFIEFSKHVIRLDEHSWILPFQHHDVYTASVDKYGITSFKKITLLSRHLPNGDLFQFTTADNKKVLTTGSHSLLTQNSINNEIIPIKAVDVTIGVKLPVLYSWTDFCKFNKKFVYTGTTRMLGIYMRCGNLSDNSIKFNINSKTDLKEIINYTNVKSIPYLYDYVDNTISFTDHAIFNFLTTCNSIPLYILSKCNLDDVYDFMMGLLPNLHELTKSKFNIKCLNQKISNDFCLLFNICLPTLVYTLKIKDGLYQICITTDSFRKALKKPSLLDSLRSRFKKYKFDIQNDIKWVEVIDIQKVTEKSYNYKFVYDFSVDDNETFMISNGIFVHNTLNTFHTAGLTINTVVTGVPRLLELMNTTKEPKSSSCSIKIFASDTIHSIFDIRNYIGPNLRCLTIASITKDYDVVKFGDIKHCWWLKDVINVLPTDDVLRIQLSHKAIYENRCSLEQIVEKINETFTDVYAVSSSLNDCILDVFITNKDDVVLPKKQVCYINDENKYQIFLDEIVYKKFEKFIIYGIEKLRDFSIFSVTPYKEWVITTDGSNLKGLMECGLFEPHTVMSNNMWEIYFTLGVEATREFLIDEFINVISSDGTFINKCHVLLLVDFMTFKGDISSISRYSLRSKNSPLSRSSFEESIENFLKSGIFSEVDNMKSISSNIMTGKLSSTGTGICDLLVDTDIYFPEEDRVASAYDFKNTWGLQHNVNDNVFMMPTIFEHESDVE
jgi:DNA-directed RNA polymerase beta' subunit